MSASKYLPPFTSDERVVLTPRATPDTSPVAPGVAVTDPEATYADFLGDEVAD